MFSLKGYTETSVREIARGVGIKESSIYNHFVSKESILQSVIERYDEYVRENTLLSWDLQKFLDIQEPFEQKILQFMALEFPEKDRKLFLKMVFIILHEQHRNDLAKEYVKKTFIRQNEMYVQGLLDELADKEVIAPTESAMVARLHMALIYFYSSRALLGFVDPPAPSSKEIGMEDMLRYIYRNLVRPIENKD